MHVHVHDTCTHVSSHVMFPEPGKYHVMMVDATPLSGEGSSVYPISNIVQSSLVFFACEAVRMPMCIGTCTCSTLFPVVVMRERERERERGRERGREGGREGEREGERERETTFSLYCTRYKYMEMYNYLTTSNPSPPPPVSPLWASVSVECPVECRQMSLWAQMAGVNLRNSLPSTLSEHLRMCWVVA